MVADTGTGTNYTKTRIQCKMFRPSVMLVAVMVLYLVYLCITNWLPYVMTLQPEKKLLDGNDDVPKPVKPTNRLLIAKLEGGLGNHLWIYASLYGIAKKTNRSPIACTQRDINKLFKSLSIPVLSVVECKRQFGSRSNATLFIEKKVSYYDTEMISRIKDSDSRVAKVSGYLNNIGYFIEYYSEIRAQFLIRERYQVFAQQFIHYHIPTYHTALLNNHNKQNTSFKLSPIFVAVHVRRGDVLKDSHKNIPGPLYFQKAMDHFRNKYGPRVIFIVVTNDLPWSKANLKRKGVFFTGDSGPKSWGEDFAIALACKHTVMSVGTFGWWMGFLTGGDVVYFKNWVKGRPWYDGGQYFPHYFKPMI